jgi:hypothetical protein
MCRTSASALIQGAFSAFASYQTNFTGSAARSVDDFVGARILSALLPYQPVALGAQPVNFGLHPAKQPFGGSYGNPGPLKILYLSTLPQDWWRI